MRWVSARMLSTYRKVDQRKDQQLETQVSRLEQKNVPSFPIHAGLVHGFHNVGRYWLVSIRLIICLFSINLFVKFKNQPVMLNTGVQIYLRMKSHAQTSLEVSYLQLRTFNANSNFRPELSTGHVLEPDALTRSNPRWTPKSLTRPPTLYVLWVQHSS